MKNLIIVLFGLLVSLNAYAANSYQSGKIKNLTATTGGVMVMLDTGLPDNCEGSPYGWMLIKQSNTAITSVVLAAWVAGKTQGTFYTSGRPNGTGFCVVIQFDPAG
jgi:hypothetical protein